MAKEESAKAVLALATLLLSFFTVLGIVSRGLTLSYILSFFIDI